MKKSIRKFSIYLATAAFLLSAILCFQPAALADPAPSPGDYIVTEYGADKLAMVTPGGVRTEIYSFTANTYPNGVAIVAASPPQYSLTINIVGSGSVAANGTSPYDAGDTVQLAATALIGWKFTGWSGDLSGSANPEYLLMDSDKTVTATFTEIPQPPVASFVWSPDPGTMRSPIVFDASGSTDSDGTIVRYEWDFGDGATATGVNPIHTYRRARTYTVTLTVSDDDGLTDTIAKNVIVNPKSTRLKAALSVKVTAEPRRQLAPGTVTWTIKVKNTGSVTFDTVEVFDTRSGFLTVVNNLYPGMSTEVSYVETGLPIGRYYDEATAVGEYGIGSIVTASAKGTCRVL